MRLGLKGSDETSSLLDPDDNDEIYNFSQAQERTEAPKTTKKCKSSGKAKHSFTMSFYLCGLNIFKHYYLNSDPDNPSKNPYLY